VLLSACCDGGQNFGAVVGNVLHVPGFDDFAGGIDEEGLAEGDGEGSIGSLHGFDGDSKGIDDGVIGVGEEFEGQAFFGAEAFVAVGGVEAYPEDDGVRGIELLQIALEVMRFEGAAPGKVLWIEVQDDPFAFVVGEADLGIVL